MADGILKVGTITTSSGSGTINLGASGETITSSAVMGSGMGKVLQVVSATYGTQESTSSTSFVADISGNIHQLYQALLICTEYQR